MLHVDELRKLEKEKHRLKKELYSKIYADFSRKIKLAASYNQKNILLRVPQFIFGYPSFNSRQAATYLKRQFELSGFYACVVSDKDLYVSWCEPKASSSRSQPHQTVEDNAPAEETFPTFINLKKLASKYKK